MNKRIDFSSNAPVYDRRHGALLSEDEVARLSMAVALHPGVRVLDIGAGTGRIAIPLSELGCEVVAIEPAWGMVGALQAKAQGTKVRIVAGEGSRLPFSDSSSDVVVIARLLYLTPDWRVVLNEAYRVLSAGGHLLHEWGNGAADEDWVQIREKARALFEEAGVDLPFHPGVRSEVEVDNYLNGLGLIRAAELPMGQGPILTLSEFLGRLAGGELSYIWNVPKSVQEECLPRLNAWSARTFDLERSIAISRQVRWGVFRKDAV